MSTYEPGTVAITTVRGVPNVRIFRSQGDWISGDTVEGAFWADDRHVTDIRPLVVLDLDDNPVPDDIPQRNEAKLLIDMLRESADEFFSADAAALARKVADQIEAQTKPPRIPEPGLWGVVQASRREVNGRTDVASGHWVRTPEDCYPWQHTSGSWTAEWEHLIDPVLVRDGIEATS